MAYCIVTVLLWMNNQSENEAGEAEPLLSLNTSIYAAEIRKRRSMGIKIQHVFLLSDKV